MHGGLISRSGVGAHLVIYVGCVFAVCVAIRGEDADEDEWGFSDGSDADFGDNGRLTSQEWLTKAFSTDSMVQLPTLKRRCPNVSLDMCFFDADVIQVGCNLGCHCRSWERCYSKHVECTSDCPDACGDVGGCGIGITAMVLLSVSIHVGFLVATVLVRYIIKSHMCPEEGSMPQTRGTSSTSQLRSPSGEFEPMRSWAGHNAQQASESF